MNDWSRPSTTVCSRCGATVPAAILEREGSLSFRRECDACGVAEFPFPENGPFYKQVLEIVGERTGERRKRFYARGEPLPPLRGVLLDVTGRCNLSCPHCFAAANEVLPLEPDLPTLDAWLNDLARACGRHRPVVFIQGGEPTLRADLPEIVALVRERGFRMKLVTNGLRLTDRAFVRRLREAGLDWVFLQFDGFSREAYAALRGADLLDVKLEALDNLVQGGFKILLACMVMKGVNLDQVGPVMDLAVRTPRVQQVSFLPASRLGREPDIQRFEATTTHDVLCALEAWSAGRLRPNDFLRFLSLSKRLWRLTGNPDFKPKTCFFPMVLALGDGGVTPLNRIVSGHASPFRWDRLRAIASLAWHLRDLDAMPYNPRLLTMVIEHFRDPDVFDLDDALHCNKFYLTERGLGPSCVFNAVGRRAERHEPAGPSCQGPG